MRRASFHVGVRGLLDSACAVIIYLEVSRYSVCFAHTAALQLRGVAAAVAILVHVTRATQHTMILGSYTILDSYMILWSYIVLLESGLQNAMMAMMAIVAIVAMIRISP